MNEKDFEYTLMVARCHSFSQAAQLLYLTQPALSRYISNLEKSLGVTLFDRSASPIQLTSAGQRFCAYATEILDLEDKLRAELLSHASVSGKAIRLGVPMLTGEYMLSRILPPMMQKFPGLQIDPIQDTSPNLCQRLTAHKLDAAFVCAPISGSSLSSELLLHEDVYLVASRSHPALAGYNTAAASLDHPLEVDFSRLVGAPLIHCKPIAIMSYLVEDALKRLQFRPAADIKASSLPLALSLAAQGMGFTGAMRCQLKYGHPETVQDLCPISLKGEGTLPFYVTYNSLMRETTPELDTFVREVHQIYEKEPYI